MKRFGFSLVCIMLFMVNVKAYEARYSLVDDGYNTPVRDQKNTSACWAFATTESIMSNMQKNGLNVQTFSPSHISALAQDQYPISGIKSFHRNMDMGGNFDISAAYTLNGWGPVLESEAPFNSYVTYLDNQTGLNLNDYKGIKPKVSVSNVAIVDNPRGACTNSSIDAMKGYIKKYGAIAAMVNWNTENSEALPNGDGTYYVTGTYLNKEYYYYDKDDAANHAITIVGWDDNVVPTNYAMGHRPQRNGAWIVKNSWGEAENKRFSDDISVSILRGDHGYYYIPYDDYNICSYWAGFYNTANNVSTYNYYYDYLGVNAYIFSETAVGSTYFANKYSKISDENEKIDRISFYTDIPGVSYEVFYSSTGNLNSYQSIGTGTFEYTGYTSIVPNKEIVVSDNYAVIVKYTYPDGVTKKIPIGMKIDNQSSYYYTYNLSGDNSFVSFDGANWRDLASEKAVASVRVYTSSTTEDTTNTTGETTTTPTQGSEPVIETVQEVPNNENVTEVIEVDVIPKNDTNINDNSTAPNGSSNGNDNQVTDKVGEGEVENPKTGSSFSWMIIIGMVLCILGVFGYTRNKKFYRL